VLSGRSRYAAGSGLILWPYWLTLLCRARWCVEEVNYDGKIESYSE
jgi:hypothetical protein